MLSSWALACSLAWSRAKASSGSVARLTGTLGRRISMGGAGVGVAGVGVASRDCTPLLFPFPKATPIHPVLRRGFGRRTRVFLELFILSAVCVQVLHIQVTLARKRYYGSTLVYACAEGHRPGSNIVSQKWPPPSQAKSEKLPSVSNAGLTKELIQVVTGVVYVLSEWL